MDPATYLLIPAVATAKLTAHLPGPGGHPVKPAFMAANNPCPGSLLAFLTSIAIAS